jgi:flavin reductase (DIM6/NTAB) family NADH-FMN oxidoreductase RutF
MIVDFNKLEAKDRYKIVSRTVIPRPIAWIVTEKEKINAAPFSYFIPLSSKPPTLIVSIGHKKDKTPKDTLKNIRETKKCTICMVNEELLTKMHYTSKSLEYEESEIETFDIQTQKIIDDFPPIIKDAPAAFFCTLFKEIDLGGKTIPLILKIEKYYVDEKYVNEGFDINLDLIARVGAKYAKFCEKIEPPKIP